MSVKSHFDAMKYKIAPSLSKEAQSKTLKSHKKRLPEKPRLIHLSLVRISGIYCVN